MLKTIRSANTYSSSASVSIFLMYLWIGNISHLLQNINHPLYRKKIHKPCFCCYVYSSLVNVTIYFDCSGHHCIQPVPWNESLYVYLMETLPTIVNDTLFVSVSVPLPVGQSLAGTVIDIQEHFRIPWT